MGGIYKPHGPLVFLKKIELLPDHVIRQDFLRHDFRLVDHIYDEIWDNDNFLGCQYGAERVAIDAAGWRVWREYIKFSSEEELVLFKLMFF